MPDLSSISIGLQSIKTALDITKELRNIDSSLKDAEVKLKLAELIEALSEAKVQLSEANDTILELKSEVKDLEAKLNLKEEIVFRDGHYYTAEIKDGKPNGPFCSSCYGGANKLILLNELSATFRSIGKYTCPQCKSTSK